MMKMKFGKILCKGLSEGKSCAQIARENNVTDAYVKNLMKRLVDAGIVKRRFPYEVRADYEEMIYEKKS